MSTNIPSSESSIPSVSPKLAYSVAEAAHLLSVSPLFVKKQCYGGQLKSKKLGRRRLIPHAALEQFIKNLPQG